MTAVAMAATMRASKACAPHDETPEMRRTVSLVVRRAQQGDRDALRFLYVRYADNVRGYVRSIVHDDHQADDITQVVFAKLITVIVKYDERAVPFFGWLLRVARNAAIDHMRSSRMTPVADVHGTEDADADDDIDRRESLEAALATLPEKQRSVLLLRHLVGLSPSEIATLLGCSESSVHGLHHRGRRAMQCELTRLHAKPCTVPAPAAA